MKITEALMLGTGAKSAISKVAYKSIHKNNLNPIVCVMWDRANTVLGFSQFALGNVEAWAPNIFNSKDLIKTSSTPTKHRVYNKDEIEFLLAYEEHKKLELELLLKLSEEHARCTFVVTKREFLDILLETSNFSRNYKYTHKEELTRDLAGIASNCTLIISFYKMNTFVFDLHSKKIEGLGISFEFLNTQQSTTFPNVYSGIYLLFTDVYEGVFYKDGQIQLTTNTIDFDMLYANAGYIMKLASSTQKKAYAEKDIMQTLFNPKPKKVKQVYGDVNIKFEKKIGNLKFELKKKRPPRHTLKREARESEERNASLHYEQLIASKKKLKRTKSDFWGDDPVAVPSENDVIGYPDEEVVGFADERDDLIDITRKLYTKNPDDIMYQPSPTKKVSGGKKIKVGKQKSMTYTIKYDDYIDTSTSTSATVDFGPYSKNGF